MLVEWRAVLLAALRVYIPNAISLGTLARRRYLSLSRVLWIAMCFPVESPPHPHNLREPLPRQ